MSNEMCSNVIFCKFIEVYLVLYREQVSISCYKGHEMLKCHRTSTHFYNLKNSRKINTLDIIHWYFWKIDQFYKNFGLDFAVWEIVNYCSNVVIFVLRLVKKLMCSNFFRLSLRVRGSLAYKYSIIWLVLLEQSRVKR